MFDAQYRSLSQEIRRRTQVFEKIRTKYLNQYPFKSAESLIQAFTELQDPSYQSSIIAELLKASNTPELQQFCYLVLTAIFWRNLTYLASSCRGRNLVPEDLLSQGNLILLELCSKAAGKPPSIKIYANLTRSLRRDFYIWVKANDFEYAEIEDHHIPHTPQSTDTDKIIKQILAAKILKSKEMELWLDVARDERSLKEIACEQGVNYDAFQKRLRRITQKIENHKN
ncbi:MAG: sigma-70 family RNA polymerase sigma factor [FCB group bacterium]|nr:sigma-70 family RNA polymerase sigma factor [FCB group bacterium]